MFKSLGKIKNSYFLKKGILKHLNLNSYFFSFQAKREDSGDYTVFAQNQHGKASINCQVKVMDKPEKPASVGKN